MAKNLCGRSEFIRTLNSHLDKILEKHLDSLKTNEIQTSLKQGSRSHIPLPEAGKAFTVYKLDGCPYSDKAGDLVQNINNAQSFYLHKDLRSDKNTIQNLLTKHTDYDKDLHHTFPVVFVGDQFLGGYQELSAYIGKVMHAGTRTPRLRYRHTEVKFKTHQDLTSLRKSGRKVRK